MYFIGLQNQVLEVIYATEIDAGRVPALIDQLKDSGRLKATVYVGAHIVDNTLWETWVHYLPTNRFYRLSHHMTLPIWMPSESQSELRAQWNALTQKEGGEEQRDQ